MTAFALRDVKYLPGVGPARAEMLDKELGIRSFEDLIRYYPYKYVDRSRLFTIAEVDGTMPYVQLKGHILKFETVGEGRGKRLVAHFTDGTSIADLVWFQGIKYTLSRYRPNVEYVIFGKPTIFGGRVNIAHPEIETDVNLNAADRGMQPYYNTSEKMKRVGLNSTAMRKLISTLFTFITEPLSETLPLWLIRREGLLSLTEALTTIHLPATPQELRMAQYRLKYEELFYIQLNILRYASSRNRRYKGLMFGRVGTYFNRFYKELLPFNLTEAQKRVLRDIHTDTCSGNQMNRLIQGDVGSGKTIVALMAMLLASDNGYQSSIVAPTEILAEQHYLNIGRMVEGLDLRVELLTGSIRGKRRKRILENLVTGDIDILVGTHAIFEDTVAFARLGLVVIDEQHRFGVAQRARMWSKSSSPPHILVMTATPIPRTLAMTLYGDLDVSVIDELPPNRKPIVTKHSYDSKHSDVYAFLDRELKLGRQAYIVYPLIEESEKMDLKNLEDGYEQISSRFAGYKVSKVHGKMKPQEKELEMQRFKSGETQILVSTTVIEVGVDVPNASVMVIENAERFGLSQLHQLRGRVGRGAEQSYCILMTGFKLSEETRKRIGIMVESNDGFQIAEADLKLRGPGDLEGTQQSGLAFDLKIANLCKDAAIIEHVRGVAKEIIEMDPELVMEQNQLLLKELKRLKKTPFDWSAIS